MKYDFELDLYGENSLAKILKLIKPGTAVLEFGPANGRMTKYLKESLNCRVYAVEIDKEAAKQAALFAEKILIGDIEKFDWLSEFKEIAFDYIVFADVLEHLYDPCKVLEASKLLLKDSGVIFISVPNIAHNSVLIDLFNNKFEYNKLGLLDDTHIRFFTYDSLQNLFYKLELVPVIEDAVYLAAGRNEIKNTYADVDEAVAYNLRKRFCGHIYQFVFALQKKQQLTDTVVLKKIKREPCFIGSLELFIDTGSGFSGQEKIQLYWKKEGRQSLLLSLEDFQEIKTIRLDPIDVPALMRIEKIKFFYLNAVEKEINTFYCNDDYSIGKTYVFLHNDAQIAFRPEDCIDLQKIEMEIDLIFLHSGETYLGKESLLYQGIKEMKASCEAQLDEMRLQLDKEKAQKSNIVRKVKGIADKIKRGFQLKAGK